MTKNDEVEITDFEDVDALKEKLTLNQLLESMKLIKIIEDTNIPLLEALETRREAKEVKEP